MALFSAKDDDEGGEGAGEATRERTNQDPSHVSNAFYDDEEVFLREQLKEAQNRVLELELKLQVSANALLCRLVDSY